MLNINNDIIQNIFKEIPIELFSVIIGYLLHLFYDFSKSYTNRIKLRNELKKLKKKKSMVRVIDIANGDPDFAKENIFLKTIDLFGHTKSLFIDLDEKHKKNLIHIEKKKGYREFQKSRFHKDTSFDGSDSFEELAEITKIKELPQLIEKHRKIVSEKFINHKEGILFNSKKYGIFDINFTRFGNDERPGVEIYLFETDYFTHRVFRSIYQELKEKNHEILKVTHNNFLQYKPFLTSFGINTLLITHGPKGKEIVLSKRSTRVHSKESLYHITMNEGLSITDRDPFGKIDLELCFKRGLLEELGITEQLYRYSVKAAFYDFFLDLNNFEIGISSVLEMQLNFEKDILPLIARDKTLESEDFVTLPLKSKEIKSFLKKNNFIPHGIYVLERVLLRENIKL